MEGFPLWNLEDKEEFLGQVRNYINGYIDSFGYPEYAPHYAWEAIEAIWDDAPPEEFPTVID